VRLRCEARESNGAVVDRLNLASPSMRAGTSPLTTVKNRVGHGYLGQLGTVSYKYSGEIPMTHDIVGLPEQKPVMTPFHRQASVGLSCGDSHGGLCTHCASAKRRKRGPPYD
jgi:hypothetical protein